MINLNGSPLEGIHFMINLSKKEFHSKDENIRGEGISLSYTCSRLETRSLPSIDQNEDRR